MSSLFGGSYSTNRVLYYLETAKLPIRYSISKRRLMYLYHILTRDTEELISKVYHIQRLKPVKYDWHNMIEEEKEKYGIKQSDEEIGCLSKNKFKQIVNEAVNKFALSKLLATAQNQSKCKTILKNINENDFKIQKYLICDRLVKEEQQLLFTLRSSSFQVKINFQHIFKDDLSCRACRDPNMIESEVHFCQTCVAFSNERHDGTLNFEDISGPLDVQIIFIKKFKLIARKWRLLLELETI